MLFTDLKNPVEEQEIKKTKQSKTKRKARITKPRNLTADEQLDCLARIVVNQLLTDLNFYENE